LKAVRFRAPLLEGHKEDAVEVPFDPAKRWSTRALPLMRGRRGHHVRGLMNRVRFESFVVARSRRFYVLVDADLKRAAGLEVGDVVEVALEPVFAKPAATAAPGTRRRS
jgi:hypothetical protein